MCTSYIILRLMILASKYIFLSSSGLNYTLVKNLYLNLIKKKISNEFLLKFYRLKIDIRSTKNKIPCFTPQFGESI